MNRDRQRLGAFTLVEVMATLVLTALLATMVSLSLGGVQRMGELNDAVERVIQYDALTRQYALQHGISMQAVYVFDHKTIKRVSTDSQEPMGSALVFGGAYRVAAVRCGHERIGNGEIAMAYSKRGQSANFAVAVAGPKQQEEWIVVMGMTGQVLRGLDETQIEAIFELQDSPMDRAFASAEHVLHRAPESCPDLRHNALGATDRFRAIRGPLNFTVAALVLLLLTFSVVSLWRASAYQKLIGDYEQAQQAVFRKALPAQQVPLDVHSRLASEERRLKGLSGASSEVPEMKSALLLLREVLIRLPDHLRFRILELRIENDQIHIEGEARAHGDADAIAVALRRYHGFDVDPPRTDKLAEKGVRFTITGTAITTGLTSVDQKVARP